MYKIVFKGKAAKQVQQITPPYFKLVSEHIDGLAQDPRPYGAERLIGEPGYKLRVGVYRVLYTIDDIAQVVTVYRVKHRREVYRD